MSRKLKIVLIKRGISQTKLSEITGIARSTISMLVSGRMNPTQDEKRKIMTALSYRGNDFFSEVK